MKTPLTREGKPRQRSGAIDKNDFNIVKRAIRERAAAGTYKAEKIAEQYGVGVSTVRTIKRTASWAKFQAAKEQSRAERLQKTPKQLPLRAVAHVNRRPRPQFTKKDAVIKEQAETIRDLEYSLEGFKQEYVDRSDRERASRTTTIVVSIIVLLIWLTFVALTTLGFSL